MVLDLLLSQSRHNLLSLSFEKQEKFVNFGVAREAITYFKQKKAEKRYWTKEHLLDQIIKKTLLIGEALYLGYVLLFLFDNAISYSIYAQDMFQIT